MVRSIDQSMLKKRAEYLAGCAVAGSAEDLTGDKRQEIGSA
jgi:hypothetical protein